MCLRRLLLLLGLLAVTICMILLTCTVAIDRQILLAPLKAHHCSTRRNLQVMVVATFPFCIAIGDLHTLEFDVTALGQLHFKGPQVSIIPLHLRGASNIPVP